VPREASKARAVAFHMRARGYAPEECIAVGDSREDMGAAAAVGTFWLVANGLERDPSLRGDLAGNVRVAEGRNGEGVYEAVITELAERR
jgi:phosphoserine phosphatase